MQNRLSIKARLTAILLLPLAALLYFGTIAFLEATHAAGEMTKIETLTSLAVHTSALVHETQIERGRTAGFLATQGAKFKSELPQQRGETDRRISELQTFLSGIDLADYGPEIQASYRDSLDQLKNIGSRRAAISGLKTSTGSALGYYTRMNGSFLDAIGVISQQSSDLNMAKAAGAYTNFLKGKELAGIERAIIAGMVGKDEFSALTYDHFLRLVAKQDTYFGVFKAAATPEAVAFFDDAMAQPAVVETQRMRDIILAHGTSAERAGGFGIDADVWFSTASRRINLLKSVEDNLAESMHQIVGDSASAKFTAAAIAVTSIVIVALCGVLTLRSITSRIRILANGIGSIAQSKDMTHRLDLTGADEISSLARTFDSLMMAFQTLLQQVSNSSMFIDAGTAQVSAASHSLASGASEQAANIQTINSSLDEIANVSRQSAENALQAASLAAESQDSAHQGRTEMTEMSQAMDAIKDSSSETAKIIKVIDEIAFQTNLLALNAAVEAARAGEAGKGFAVVAEEVRSLAQRCAEAAKSTSAMIDQSANRAEKGVSVAEQVGRSLDDINTSTNKVNSLLDAIAAAATEQSEGLGQITSGVCELDSVTQQTAGNSEELAAAAEETSAQVQSLRDLVGQFKVGSDETDTHAAPRAVPSKSSVTVSPAIKAKPVVAAAPTAARVAARPMTTISIPLDEDEEDAFQSF